MLIDHLGARGKRAGFLFRFTARLCKFLAVFALSFSATNIVVCLLSQTPYYWPSSAAHGHTPDNLEYAIYLAKRSLRNKQRHGLEDYELVRHTSYFTPGKAFASQRSRYET